MPNTSVVPVVRRLPSIRLVVCQHYDRRPHRVASANDRTCIQLCAISISLSVSLQTRTRKLRSDRAGWWPRGSGGDQAIRHRATSNSIQVFVCVFVCWRVGVLAHTAVDCVRTPNWAVAFSAAPMHPKQGGGHRRRVCVCPPPRVCVSKRRARVHTEPYAMRRASALGGRELAD